MIIQSKYTKIFHSKDLTRLKYDELYNFAVLIQNHKNTVSQYVNNNLLHFLECNKFQFLKEMRERFKDVIPTQKPIKVSERILALCGVKEGNLLVPFAGSGTEMVAGLNFGMNVTGFEIESDYISIAQKRLEDALQKKNNSLFL